MLALAASTPRLYVGESFAQQVPNSSGTEPATLKAPPGACDCHHHIYDAVRFPAPSNGGRLIPDARLEEFRLPQRRLGTTRNIVVTPSAYVTDAEPKTLAGRGICGIRFSITDTSTAVTSVDMIEPLSKRVNETNKPDDALLFDLMLRWAPEERTRNRILVQNPAELYGFDTIRRV